MKKKMYRKSTIWDMVIDAEYFGNLVELLVDLHYVDGGKPHIRQVFAYQTTIARIAGGYWRQVRKKKQIHYLEDKYDEK